MTVFEFDDYKSFLKKDIGRSGQIRGYQAELASAAGCQRAYLSQVLHGNANITFDQAIGLCQFWQFNESEEEYFIELVQLSRAGTQNLRNYTLKRLTKLRSEQSELSMKFKSTGKLSREEQALYYSSWIYAAVHVLSSIPEFQNELAIAERLKLPRHQVKNIVGELERMRLVETKKNGKLSPVERDLFLPRQSYMTFMLHSNWRYRALSDVANGTTDSIHYTSLHGLSKTDCEVIRTMVLDFLTAAKQVVEPSNEEDVICLNLDFFRV